MPESYDPNSAQRDSERGRNVSHDVGLMVERMCGVVGSEHIGPPAMKSFKVDARNTKLGWVSVTLKFWVKERD